MCVNFRPRIGLIVLDIQYISMFMNTLRKITMETSFYNDFHIQRKEKKQPAEFRIITAL